METRPPALIDGVVRRLIPPACREHVLGDLWERYVSPRQYVMDGLRTLPFVLASQIRRTVNPVTLAIQILVVFGALGGFRPTDAPDGTAWLRAACPAAVAAIALMLRDVYRGRTVRPLWQHAALDAATAAVLVLLSQVVLAEVTPQIALESGALIGSGATFLILFLGRVGTPLERDLRASPAARGPMSRADFVSDVRDFERTVRQRNRHEIWAGVVVVVAFSYFLWRGPELVTRIANGLVVAGALFIIYYIRRAGAPDPVPLDLRLAASLDIYRGELERQRDLLRSVVWWYLLPLFPGLALLFIGRVGDPSAAGSLAVFLGFWLPLGALVYHLNQRAARKLQEKIDGLAVAETHE